MKITKTKKYNKTKSESYLIGVFFCTFFFGGFLAWQNALAACTWTENTGTVASPYDDADMDACITDSASKTGDVAIIIPTCNVTWDTAVTINMSSWTNVTSLMIQGASKTGTVLTYPGFNVTTAAGKKFRLTNMTIVGPGISSVGAVINMAGDTRSSDTPAGGYRIDNLILNSGSSGQFFYQYGSAFGLLDNLNANWYGQFVNVSSSNINYQWAADDTFGTADAIYMENCTITNARTDNVSMLMDNWLGARTVIRYNTVIGYYIGGHDLSTVDVGSTIFRSNRHWEVYNNRL